MAIRHRRHLAKASAGIKKAASDCQRSPYKPSPQRRSISAVILATLLVRKELDRDQYRGRGADHRANPDRQCAFKRFEISLCRDLRIIAECLFQRRCQRLNINVAQRFA